MVLLLLFNTELTRESSLISFQSLVVVSKGGFIAVKKGRVVSTLSEEVDSFSWRVVSFTLVLFHPFVLLHITLSSHPLLLM
jgi:hypothetical protein